MSVDSKVVKHFRANLADLLQNLGCSQGEFAERCGMGRPHLNRLLQGKQVPRLDLVERLADELGVGIDMLILPHKKNIRRPA